MDTKKRASNDTRFFKDCAIIIDQRCLFRSFLDWFGWLLSYGSRCVSSEGVHDFFYGRGLFDNFFLGTASGEGMPISIIASNAINVAFFIFDSSILEILFLFWFSSFFRRFTASPGHFCQRAQQG